MSHLRTTFSTSFVLCCLSLSFSQPETTGSTCGCEAQIEDFRKTVDSMRWKLQDLVGIQYKIRSLEREMRVKDERLKDFGKRLSSAERRTQVVKEKHPRNDKVQEGLIGEPVSGILFNINERFSNIDLRLQAVEQDLRNISQSASESLAFKQMEELMTKAQQNIELNVLINVTKIIELENFQDLRSDLDNVTQLLGELKADYEANEAIRRHAQKLRENFMEHIKQSGSAIKLEDLLPTALNSDDDENGAVHIQISGSDLEDEEVEEEDSTPGDLEPEVTDWKEPNT